ncbi:MAG: 6,7-dimethyl-8-ribityllumazine synthase [Candidatus Omnitrophica bacterium]|nr:6,7-dimethyl-8-ribityllumazine synthase [Candidatus Omnitrophota bacterium]MCG2702812.1 6,7-dimethyl-8-ribityllumazine synthase [Candidatus Omnitrophota bacterium]
MKVTEAKLDAKGKSFVVLVSRFNNFITKRLLDGALHELNRHGADEKKIEVVWLPGAFELPCVAQKLAKSKKYDAIICLAAIIKGDTPHFDYVASEAAKGIASVSLTTGVPVIFGVITAETMDQAIERAGSKSGNKGEDAARVAIEMANLLEMVG